MSKQQDSDQRWSDIIRVGEIMAARMGGKFVVDARKLADMKAKEADSPAPQGDL